jgi:CRP-like cAMP-binding protein
MEVAALRPQRWDTPYGDPLRDDEVDRLLAIEPFRDIDPARFPATLPLREIMRNDARLLRFTAGDVIVREGDYGHSAFLILSGRVRVVLAGLSPEALGREEPTKLGWLGSLLRVVRQPKLPEVRDNYGTDATAHQSDRPRVFLQDVPRVLEQTDTTVLEPGEIFGELAALTRSPRSATVFAEGDAVLLEIRWQGLRDLMRRTDALRLHIERLYRENS